MFWNKSKDKYEVKIRKGYHEIGALNRETPCENGKIHGIEKFYYESGVLSWETPYEGGKRHGY
ncbi:MAG: hypothetical protein M0P75_07180 [Candidatus Marinimicrobia bacterium]|jgi:antitoxin component YwqK of YwqJK toxin-antitoxin module|nr:hypothetical protein [Candidatus Neomarinimicrobiota bacterium]